MYTYEKYQKVMNTCIAAVIKARASSEHSATTSIWKVRGFCLPKLANLIPVMPNCRYHLRSRTARLTKSILSQSASVYVRHALVFVLRGSGLVQVASCGLSNFIVIHQRSLGTSTHGSIIFPPLQSAFTSYHPCDYFVAS